MKDNAFFLLEVLYKSCYNEKKEFEGMEYNVKMNVTAEEFFDTLAQSIAFDISESTGKKVKAKNLKRGLSYTKKFGKRKTAKVTITKFERPYHYQAKFESVGGTNFIAYEIEELSDGIGISYSEKVEKFNGKEGGKGLAGIWARLMGPRKTRRMLMNMESYILDQRKKQDLQEKSVND